MSVSGRIQTSNYNVEVDTQFQWALTGSVHFNRAFDLYKLAQAVEKHDHSLGRGLPVARMATDTITEVQYKTQSVSTRALANESVTTPKIYPGAVTDAKLQTPKVNLDGSNVMTGGLTIQSSANPSYAQIVLGNAGAAISTNLGSVAFSAGPGGIHQFAADMMVYRAGAPTTGRVMIGNGGNYLGFDGTQMTVNGARILTTADEPNIVGVPLNALVAFRNFTDIGAAGAGWSYESNLNGRLLVGSGTSGGKTWTEATAYEGNWVPTTGLAVSGTGLTAAGGSGGTADADANAGHRFIASAGGAGATEVNTSNHTHPISGGGGGAVTGNATVTHATSWNPPLYAVCWARRST